MASVLLPEIDKAFIFHQRCDSRSMKTVALPFFEAVHSNLIDCGFVENLQGFSLPAGFFAAFEDKSPQAAAGSKGWIVGLSLFLGCSIGEWSLNKSYDYLYNEKIQPAIQVLKDKITGEKAQLPGNSSYCFQYGIWYAADETYLQLNIYVDKPEDLGQIKNLILRAENETQKMIAKQKMFQKVIIFTVKSGEIVGNPIVSDKLLQLMPNKTLGPVR